MSVELPAFPKALDDDEDDVAWALQTAQVQWDRGGYADAVVWLRRAAEAAVEAGEFGRAADLQRNATYLEGWLAGGATPAFSHDDDDGVDDLLAEAPEIEAQPLEGPTPSLVDALELEARAGRASLPPYLPGVRPEDDLGDVEDVEDIETIEVEDLEEEGAASAHASTSGFPGVHGPSEELDSYDEPPEEATVRPPSRGSHGTAVRAPLPPVPRPPPATPRPSLRLVETPSEPAHAAGAPVTAYAPDEDKTQSFRVPDSIVEPDLATRPRSEPPARAPFGEERVSNSVFESPTKAGVPAEPPAGATAPASSAEQAPASVPAPAAPAVSSTPPVLTEAPTSESTLLDANPLGASPSEPPGALDVDLIAACRGLEDLPPETQAELAARARVEVLAPDQEVSGFGLAVVAEGEVYVMPTIAEAVCGHAKRGEPIFSRGNLADGVGLRAVAIGEGARVAVFRPEDFEHVLETCPWVAEELRAVADRYQALAGAAMGILGERLDDLMRSMVTDRCEVRFLAEADVLIEQGTPVGGLCIVGSGKLELVVDGALAATLGPGDLPFASDVLSHAPAPGTLRAGPGGALVLEADRMATHELLVSVPPLLELLAV